MARVSLASLKIKAREIYRILSETYPDAKCALDFRNPYELLAATILSAQCTDERVNMVTPALFDRFPDPHSLAIAEQEEVEQYIKTTGFFRNKAKSLIGMAKAIVENHNGIVPQTMEELNVLPGVGRKTANVVLGNCFDVPGITVDTHMIRLSNRFGLTKNTDPVKIEKDLMKILPEDIWTMYCHRIITHGRQICKARKPECYRCPITLLCSYYQKSQKSSI